MKTFQKLLAVAILVVSISVSLHLPAHAFTDLGSRPIELGDRIEVTVGPDQSTAFTYTPTKNVRCNIYQDCDQYMTLVHISPFHMDSAQDHWSDASPHKGVRFSMKAGVTYTMEIAMPAHFQGGTFTVYFDLVEWLPDSYFSSGASWDAIGNPEPDAKPDPNPEPLPGPEPIPTPPPSATPVGIEVVSPLTIPFTFGCEDYGRLEEPNRYVFSPANYNLYKGLVFDILYSDGSRETVTWNDLLWPAGTAYNPEQWEAYYKERSVLVVPFVNGETQFFPSFDGPGPVTFLVDCGGMIDDFTMDLLPADGSPFAEGSTHIIPNFTGHIDLSAADIAHLARQKRNVTLQGEEFTVSLDAAALSGISAQTAEGGQLTLHTESSGLDRLTTLQQEMMNACHFVTLMDITLEYSEQTIHQLGGTAAVTFPFLPEPGTDPNHYAVYYLAEDGSMEGMLTSYEDGFLTFHTEHFSFYAVVYEAPASEPQSEESTTGAEEAAKPEPPQEVPPPVEETDVRSPLTFPAAAIAATAVLITAAAFILRKKRRKA